MDLTVLLFASWAEAVGAPSVVVRVGADATVAEILDAVRARTSGRTLPRPLVAVNHAYARPTARVAPGDEVAIIPPVAGG